MLDAQPSQHIGHSSLARNIVYIINCVWAAVLQECRQSFGKNCLHPGIQSAIEVNSRGYDLLKTNFVFPEEGCFFSSKSGVDLWRNHGATCVQEKV